MMTLILSPAAPLAQTEKQVCSCFLVLVDYFMDIAHTGLGKT